MKISVLFFMTLPLLCFANRVTAQSTEVKINHDGTDGFAIEADGTIRADGEAQTWRDELHPLIGKTLYATKANVATNFTEFTVDFQDDADTTDGVLMNIQLNHDWDGITPVQPHLHWFQAQNAIPNWLIAYRWHQNGNAKVTGWTYQEVATTAFSYSSGTILQINGFGSITPPASPDTTGVSSILQLKLMRDTKKEVYSTDDPYTGDAAALSLDIHIRIDTQGSRDEYTK